MLPKSQGTKQAAADCKTSGPPRPPGQRPTTSWSIAQLLVITSSAGVLGAPCTKGRGSIKESRKAVVEANTAALRNLRFCRLLVRLDLEMVDACWPLHLAATDCSWETPHAVKLEVQSCFTSKRASFPDGKWETQVGVLTTSPCSSKVGPSGLAWKKRGPDRRGSACEIPPLCSVLVCHECKQPGQYCSTSRTTVSNSPFGLSR